MMMNSFSLALSGKQFICPFILNDSFAGYSNLGCRSLPFMTLNTSFQTLLAYEVCFFKDFIYLFLERGREGGRFSWGGVEGWGEKAYNSNGITIKFF